MQEGRQAAVCSTPEERENLAAARWNVTRHERARWTSGISAAALAVLLPAMAADAWAQPGPVDCAHTTTGKVPLPELGAARYCRDGFCVPGGLYPDGSPTRPPALEEAALAAAESVVPLDTAGDPSPDGAIVMIAVGMSNTLIAFEGNASSVHTPFHARADADPAKNPQLVIINGAQGGIGAEEGWADPACSPNRSDCWQVIVDRVTRYRGRAALTPAQVQVVWLKHAQHPVGGFPALAEELQGYLEAIVRNIKTHFPNTRLVFVSSRTYSYVWNWEHGEPDTYEGGLALRWMIEKQMSGHPSLNYDPARGPVVAPLVVWGPYLWNDGAVPRSDGLVWTCAEQGGDMWAQIHPEPRGAQKNSDQLFAFFKTDPLATPWYLRQSVVGEPAEVRASADVTRGPAPLTVHFSAAAVSGQIAEYAWTYGDGTFSYNPGGDVNAPPFYDNPNPTKVFRVPGSYTAYLTATDTNGNPIRRTVSIEVTDGEDGADGGVDGGPDSGLDGGVDGGLDGGDGGGSDGGGSDSGAPGQHDTGLDAGGDTGNDTGPSDGGSPETDGGVGEDAGPAADMAGNAQGFRPAGEGCNCGVANSGARPMPALLALLILGLGHLTRSARGGRRLGG